MDIFAIYSAEKIVKYVQQMSILTNKNKTDLIYNVGQFVMYMRMKNICSKKCDEIYIELDKCLNFKENNLENIIRIYSVKFHLNLNEKNINIIC